MIPGGLLVDEVGTEIAAVAILFSPTLRNYGSRFNELLPFNLQPCGVFGWGPERVSRASSSEETARRDCHDCVVVCSCNVVENFSGASMLPLNVSDLAHFCVFVERLGVALA